MIEILFVLFVVLGLTSLLVARNYLYYQFVAVAYDNTEDFIPIGQYKAGNLIISVENGKIQVADGNNTVNVLEHKK